MKLFLVCLFVFGGHACAGGGGREGWGGGEEQFDYEILASL